MQVKEATAGNQWPLVVDGVVGSFYFRPPAGWLEAGPERPEKGVKEMIDVQADYPCCAVGALMHESARLRNNFRSGILGPQRFLRVIMRLKVVENLSKLMHCFGSQSAMLGENAPFCEFLRV